jgi:hypothetical protein
LCDWEGHTCIAVLILALALASIQLLEHWVICVSLELGLGVLIVLKYTLIATALAHSVPESIHRLRMDPQVPKGLAMYYITGVL